MKKAVIIVYLFLVFIGITSGQLLKQEIEKHSLTVAYIYSENIEMLLYEGKNNEIWFKDPKTSEFKPKLLINSGTGFFIHKNDRYSTYLVTAAHVAKYTNMQTKIVVAGIEGNPVIKNLKEIVFKKDTLDWKYSQTSDIAVILLNMQFMDEKDINLRTLSIDYLESDYEPDRSHELTCVGFPLNIGFNKFFSPVTKSSKPASGYIEVPNPELNRYETVFLLDDSSTPGFSGSPVFEFPNQIIDKESIIISVDTKIVGLVQGYISNKGQVNSGGFAAIVPASIVKKELESASAFSGIIDYTYRNGKPWSKVEVKNGIPVKVFYNYDLYGNEQDKGNLKEGNGTLNIYSEDGKLVEVRTYKNGRMINTKIR